MDDLKARGADAVICLAHLGVDSSSEPNTSYDLLKNVPDIDFVIDGHSHSVMLPGAAKLQTGLDENGKPTYIDNPHYELPIQSTGTKLAYVGVLIIDNKTKLPEGLEMLDLGQYEYEDAKVTAAAKAIMEPIDAEYSAVFAKSEVDLNGDKEPGNRTQETNLGNLITDAMMWAIKTKAPGVDMTNAVAITNGGGIRADVPAGDWTFKTCKQVSPFGNVACLMSVTGKQIQDALEFAARFAGEDGKENGGFLQVAGATYEIHTDIPNTVQTDEKNVWIGSATGTPRVQNVKIYDKASGSYLPLDPGATYALAGMNYTLRNLGDGFAMFDGAELIKDYVSEDYLVMSTYAMTFDGADAAGLPHLSSANSPLAAYPGYLLNYEQPYGAGRITIL